MNRTVKKIWNAVSWVLVTAVVVLAVLLAGVRLVGITPYAVLSGSMEPTYPVGSLIYVKDADPEDIQVGDPITFVLNEDLVVATHRVIDIDEENGYFYTKGDANDAPDGAPVLFENLVGKPVFCVPELGYFSDWITNPRVLISPSARPSSCSSSSFSPTGWRRPTSPTGRPPGRKNARPNKTVSPRAAGAC